MYTFHLPRLRLPRECGTWLRPARQNGRNDRPGTGSMATTRSLIIVCLGLIPLTLQAEDAGIELSLDVAIELAVRNDPWLTSSSYRESALSDQAIAAATLPDPRVNVMAANFPLDSFDIRQEPMTQLAIGVSQMFPRGDTLQLARQQKEQLANQEPMLRFDRQAKVTAMTAQMWLEVYLAQQSIALIEADRGLFVQLVDVARAGYASAVGRARQQDLIRAQLELTRLEDRLTMLSQKLQSAQQRLSEWIGPAANQAVTQALPLRTMAVDLNTLLVATNSNERTYERIRRHPALLAFDLRVDAMATGVDLARQKYKPEWGLSAQYGYRADDRMGRSRADLFSVGLTFDLPIFTDRRQDKEVSAAQSLTDASRADKDLLARQLMAELRATVVQLQRVAERNTLYQSQLLPQMTEQAEASLAAYDNDDGDFAEAVRARIAELNARIDALGIAVERLQLVFRLNYVLTQAPNNEAGELR
jgi:outer membrane protein TolC